MTHGEPASRRTTARLVAVIAAILVVAALKLSAPVTLPIAVAIFIITLVQPLEGWLERRVPGWLAVTLTTLVVLAAAAVVASGFVLSIGQLTEHAPEARERLDHLAARLSEWARSHGIPLPDAATRPDQAAERAAPLVGRLFAAGATTLERLGLIAAFFILGLLEVRDFERKVERRLRQPLGEEIVKSTRHIAHRVRRYLAALTLTCVVSGVATGLFCWAMGLDSPFTWGLVAFLLNYVPTIGPFVAVIPPSLFALVQFDNPVRALAVFVGVGAIQFLIGNFVDPKIEGRALSLSPAVVLLAIIFWGWVWGVFGALLAVPITVALVIVAEQSPGTRWLAALLTEAKQ